MLIIDIRQPIHPILAEPSVGAPIHPHPHPCASIGAIAAIAAIRRTRKWAVGSSVGGRSRGQRGAHWGRTRHTAPATWPRRHVWGGGHEPEEQTLVEFFPIGDKGQYRKYNNEHCAYK